MKFETAQKILAGPDEHVIGMYTPSTQNITRKQNEYFNVIGKSQYALAAAEKYVIKAYTSLTRATTNQWGWDFKDLAKLRYRERPEQRDDFLIVSIKRSRIVEHVTVPEEQWIIEVIPDVGIELEAEEYIVYQGQRGNWIVTLWK
jgi:hypothetical protein